MFFKVMSAPISSLPTGRVAARSTEVIFSQVHFIHTNIQSWGFGFSNKGCKRGPVFKTETGPYFYPAAPVMS